MARGILLAVVVLVLVSPNPLAGQQGSNVTKPLLLVYSQGEPAYGRELANILSGDPRIDAQILVLTDPDLFKSMLYFPSVKVVLAVFNHDKDEGLGEHLQNFFEGGGGMVGLGFAGWQTTTRQASQTVFPLNASSYIVGSYNASARAYMHDLYVDEAHPISRDIGDFTAYTHKVFVSADKASGQQLSVKSEGEVTVVYRDAALNAPAVVVYEAAGVSVTFACFAGDSVERAPTYFGRFTSREEFRKLLRNSIAWVWASERRYGKTMSSALARFAEEAHEADEIRAQAELSARQHKTHRLLRTVAIAALAVLGVGAIHRKCFAPSSRKTTVEEQAKGG